MDRDVFLQEFSPRLRAGDAAVVCGAGISVPSQLPSWEELLREPRSELKLPDTFSDLSLLATYYVSQIDGGRARLTRRIQAKLTDPDIVPNEIHHKLWDLPLPYLWSLNFDNLLEDAHEIDRSHRPRIIQSDESMVGSLARGGCTLVKMHGGVSDIEASDGRRIVITRDDFDAYIASYPRTWARLLADFYTKSILFIGISFADPNMQTLLRLVRTATQSVTQRHYTLVERDAENLDPEVRALHALQRADLARGGVQAVEIDTFGDLSGLLTELAVRSRPRTIMLAGSLTETPNRIHAFMSAFGTRLATVPGGISLVHGGSQTISVVPHRFAEYLERIGEYSDSRLVQVRRCEPGPGSPDRVTERRLGEIVFPGVDASSVRRDLCSRAAVCVVIGGGEHTRAEIKECQRQGVPIIPIPTGESSDGRSLGLSQELWDQMSQEDGPLSDNLRAFDASDPNGLAEQVVACVRRCLFLDVRVS